MPDPAAQGAEERPLAYEMSSGECQAELDALRARLEAVEGALRQEVLELSRINEAIKRCRAKGDEPGPRSMETALRVTEQHLQAALNPTEQRGQSA